MARSDLDGYEATDPKSPDYLDRILDGGDDL